MKQQNNSHKTDTWSAEDSKKNNPWAYILIGAAGLGMLFIGVPMFGGFGGSKQIAASVNGQDISSYQFTNAVNALRAQQQSLDTQNDNALKQIALNQLINQNLLSQHALQSGYEYSDQSLEQILRQQFPSADDYQNMLKNNNINAQIYENNLRASETQQNYYQMLLANSVPETSAINTLISQLAQTRDINLIRLPLQRAEQNINPDENAINSYYDSHKNDYQSAETIDLQYLLLSPETLADSSEISEAELAAAREKEANNSQRDGQYLIFDNNNDAEKAANALKDGTQTFADIMADIKSGKIAGQAGNLEKHTKGKGVSQQADDALFALKKTGNISPLFDTEYGKMMVELGQIDNPAQTLSDEQLKAKIAQEKATEQYTQLANQLFDSAQNGDDIAQLATISKGKVQSLNNLTPNSAEPAWLKNPEVQSQLFGAQATAVNKLGPPIALDNTHSLFFSISKREKPQIQALSSVREKVIADLRRNQAQAQLEKAAEAISNAWEKAEDTHALVQAQGGEEKTLNNLSQIQSTPENTGLSAETLSKLLNQNSHIAINTADNGDLLISRLVAVHAGDGEKIDPQLRTLLTAQLNDASARSTMNGIVEYLRTQANIEVHQDVVNAESTQTP